MQYSLHNINAQVASGGKVPMKPGGCNHSHIPKALEHLTGLPNPQPKHEPPAPGPQQAPVTHKPNGSVEKKYIYISDRIRKKVSAVDSNTVPAARVLWPPPWLADWPITHARDTQHTNRLLCQHRTLQSGSRTE